MGAGHQTPTPIWYTKWIAFCTEHDVDIFTPTFAEALDFLASLFQNKASYSTINTVRSALSSFLLFGKEMPFGELPIVRRFMKGVYELRPTFPKHKEIWDVKILFYYFHHQDCAAALTLNDLTLKVTILLLLLSGQRCQTIQYLSINQMHKSADKYVFA